MTKSNRKVPAKKRVWLICQNFPPEVVGGASRNYDLARYLAEFGATVEIVCNHPTYPFGIFKRKWKLSEKQKLGGLNIRRIWTWQPKKKSPGTLERVLYYLLFSLHALIRLVFSAKKDDIVITSQPPDSNALAGIVLKKLKKCIWVADIRDLWQEAAVELGFIKSNGILDRATNFFKGWAYKEIDAIGYVGDKIRHYLMAQYGLEGDRFIPNPNGVDPRLFYPKDISKEKMFIFVGNMGFSHDVEQLVKMLRKTGERKQDMQVWIVGDGERRGDVERVIQENNLANVRLLGALPRDKVPELISQSLGGLIFDPPISSLDSALSIKSLEYMACGVPIFGMADKGFKEIIEKYGCGYIVDNNNADELLNCLERILLNPTIAATMGNNGRKFVLDNFNKEHTIRAFWEAINCRHEER